MARQYPRQHTAIDVGAAEHDGNAFPRVKRAFLNGGSQCGGAGALRGVVGVFVELDAGRFAPGMPLRCFIPRARVGRDAPPDRQQQSHKVSIHAPAWGATVSQRPYRRVDPVSIHAPAWGATHIGGATVPTLEVSIHAPAWGATVAEMLTRHESLLFQSTRPRGARRARHPGKGRGAGFQSTLPRGARPPRRRASTPGRLVSIHAPAWGATTTATPGAMNRSFQSTRPRGARLGFAGNVVLLGTFQSTRPRGARRRPCEPWRIRSCFNPRARVGRDTGSPVTTARTIRFNPRARVGRDLGFITRFAR